MSRKIQLLSLFAAVMAVMMVFGLVQTSHAVLKAVGPTSSPVPPGNGFPIWYQDAGNLVLDLCLPAPGPERAGGYCLTLPADFPAPNDPVAFPGNFSAEAFWWSAGATMLVPNGSADLVLALEAAFSSGETPINGDQVAFGRVRVRIDVGVAGVYTVTHPYGVLTFDVSAADVAGARGINFTSDIGIGAPLDFTGALNSAIGPFLRAAACPTGDALPFFTDPSIPGNQYVGQPGVDVCVVGGTQFGTTLPNVNTFRVEGPANAFGLGISTIETTSFQITGRRFLGTPIVIDRATYTRTAAGNVAVDVFATAGITATSATSTSGAVVDAPMAGVGANKLFSHMELGVVAVPATASVTAQANDPLVPQGVLNPTTVSATLQDLVTIITAQYNLATSQMTILAASSDQFAGGATLTEQTFGPIPNGTVFVQNGLLVPPAEVVVNSSAGGAVTKPVDIVNITATGVLGFFKAGLWTLDFNGDGIVQATDGSYLFGAAGSIPVVGDWNASGKPKIGVFTNGTWQLDLNGNGIFEGTDSTYSFGFATDKPVVGDWNGDGKTKIGLFRNGNWYLDYNGNGQWDGCGAPALPGTDACLSFGLSTDIPVTGDWGGTGQTKIGVFRGGSWYLDLNGNGVWDPGVDSTFTFGTAGDKPVVGDWDRTGTLRIGIFRNGTWALDIDGDGAWNPANDRLVEGFGADAGTVPVTGNW
jgi:hypothetical protein